MSGVSKTERETIERLRLKVRAEVRERLSDSEAAGLPYLKAGAHASLACENLFLSEAELAFDAMLDEERVPLPVRPRYAIQFFDEIDKAARNEAAE